MINITYFSCPNRLKVGAVNVDSLWSTGVNNFVWDEKKFPNASAMIEYFHSINIRVICWVHFNLQFESNDFKGNFNGEH